MTNRLQTEAEVAHILEERALEAAKPPSDDDARLSVETLLVRVHNEVYAVDQRSLSEVAPAIGIAAVPCTPTYVSGIINVRGEILTVLDLGVALGFDPVAQADSDAMRLLLVRLDGIRVALRVDEILGGYRLDLDKLDRSIVDQDFTHGIADAKIVFLDLKQLLTNDKFELLEEVN